MADRDVVQTIQGSSLQVSAGWLAAGKPAEFCPVSATAGHTVKQVTLGNHLRPEHWRWARERGFYFCSAPTYPVVYYHDGESVYFTEYEIRTHVGIKSHQDEIPLPVCYCMNVTEEQIIEEIQVKRCCTSLEDIKNYTQARTGKLCHVTNPSGKCCGKHVTAVVEKALAGTTDGQVERQARAICSQIPEE